MYRLQKVDAEIQGLIAKNSQIIADALPHLVMECQYLRTTFEEALTEGNKQDHLHSFANNLIKVVKF